MTTGAKNDFLHQTEALFNEIDFKTIFLKLIYYKWLILLVTLLFFISGLFYITNMTPKYVSTALIQVDSQLGSANNIQQMLGNVGNAFTGSEKASPAEIEIALIQSRFILQSVIDKYKLNIKLTPHYFPFIGKTMAKYQEELRSSSPFGLSQFAWGGEKSRIAFFEVDHQLMDMNFYIQAESQDKYGLYLADGSFILHGSVGKIARTQPNSSDHISLLVTELHANKGTHFDISFSHTEDVLMGLLKNLSVTDLGAKNKTKTGILQLFYYGNQPQLIANILNAIVDFAIQRNIEKKSAEASKTLAFLNRQLPIVQKSLEEAETSLNDYRARQGTIDITQEAKVLLTQLATIEQSIAELKLKRVEMLQELTTEHPFVIALAKKQEQLQKHIVDLETKIKTLPKTDQQALTLERDVKVKNQLYLLLLNNIQQLQVLKAGTLSDIRVLSQASVPIMPVPMHKSFSLLCTTIAGLFSALVMIFLRELFQNKATDHELIEEKLGISTYAIVPYSPKQKQLHKKMKDSFNQASAMMLAKDFPKDIAIEAIRSLRTMLQFNLEQAGNNIISILGASPSIGKSFISINLSQVLSECNKRVLLIDGDMRKGKLNQYLAQKKSPGLSELLSGHATAANTISHGTHGFDFISCGTYPTHPSELLMRDQLSILLKKFSAEYDIVIIDTSPVLAVTDAIILAKYSATNLMVIGAGSDKIAELELMIKRVKKNGVHIQGFVLNNVSRAGKAYGQFNYYYAYDSAAERN